MNEYFKISFANLNISVRVVMKTTDSEVFGLSATQAAMFLERHCYSSFRTLAAEL